MDILPEGYIDISTLEPPPRKTLRADIKAIVARFGKQEFFAKHIMWALREEEHYLEKDPDTVYASVRPEILKLARDGKIEIVSRGKPGTCNVYRNIEESAE